MFRENKNLLIIALIAIVNALGYGIIIPVLYSYSHKFGLNDFQNGLLFSIYSAAQFLATPVIGRLSDAYGRKPLLVISITGTAISFFMMAFAPSGLFLFLARALDGITAGNIPVASAVISDSTKPADRAKGFGIIGASFGFGFIFGPAISALTLGYGQSIPFIIAGVVSAVAAIITAVALPETNMHKGVSARSKLFDFSHLVHALFDKAIGVTLFITLLYAVAFSMFIYGYQPLSVTSLHLSATLISVNFTVIGIVGLLTQVLLLPKLVKRFKDVQLFQWMLFLEMTVLFGFFTTVSYSMLIVVSLLHALANAFVNPLIQTFLSREVDAHSQGTIQGVNASYMSIGMIIGPLIGGAVSMHYSALPFLVAAFIVFSCYLLAGVLVRRSLNAHVAL